KFNQSILLNQKFIQAWVYKGICLEKLEQYTEAIRCYQQALEINPDNADLWYNKSAAYCRMRRYDDALNCLNKVAKIEPERPFVRTMRSLILDIPLVWSQPSLEPNERPTDQELADAAAAAAKLQIERGRETYTKKSGEIELGD
ncbi:MAG: tetratricopeptide repeat protein, partial [Cyanobacteria bacterium J06621_12]